MNGFSYLKGLLLISLITMSVPALAEKGGDGSGGGNTLNHKLVEKYVHKNPSDIPGYKELQARIEQIRKTFPSLALMIENRLKEVDWYVIPKKITELPAEKTGLFFATNQAAYQTRTEIFLSEPAIKKMLPKELGDLFVHEGIMALQEKKSADLVRPVVSHLLSDKIDSKQQKFIQDFLAKNEFGPYYSADQFEDILQKQYMWLTFKNMVYQARQASACTGNIESDRQVQGEAEKYEESRWIGAHMNIASQLVNYDDDGHGMMVGNCTPNYGVLCNETWGKLTSDHANEVPNAEIRLAAKAAAARVLNQKIYPANAKLVEKFAESDAYLTVAALAKPDRHIVQLNLKKMPPESRAIYDRVMEKVAKKRQELDLSNPEAVAAMQCRATKDLRAVYLHAAPKDSLDEEDKKELPPSEEGKGDLNFESGGSAE